MKLFGTLCLIAVLLLALVPSDAQLTKYTATGAADIASLLGYTPANASTALTAPVANASLANSAITVNGSAVSLGGTRTLSLASSDFANQGTTTTVLHGNAAGNPSFGSVVAADAPTLAPLASPPLTGTPTINGQSIETQLTNKVSNWTASGSTNSALAGNATVNALTVTNTLTVSGSETLTGNLSGSGDLRAGAGFAHYWTGRSQLLSPSDGAIYMRNSSGGLLEYIGGTVKVSTATTGNIGGGEDTLITYTIPAAQLGVNGDRIKFDTWGSTAANANTKDIKVYFGSTVIYDSTALVLNGVSWRCHGTVARTGATTQTATAEFTISGTLLGAVTTTTTTTSSPAETLSGTVVFKCTGTDSGVTPADNSIVQNAMTIEFGANGN